MELFFKFSDFFLAISKIDSALSIPITFPSGNTFLFIKKDISPVPQHKSPQFSPALGFARLTNSRFHKL